MYISLQRIYIPKVLNFFNWPRSSGSSALNLRLNSVQSNFCYSAVPSRDFGYYSKRVNYVKKIYYNVNNHKNFFGTGNPFYLKKISTFESNEKKFNIPDETFDKTFLSNEEWLSLIKEVTSKQNRRFSRDVFDTFVFQKCLKLNNIGLAVSYVESSELENVKINLYALSFYLKLLGQNIHTVNPEMFLNFYGKLKEEVDLPNAIICNIIEALSMTNYWELSIPYIELLEKSSELKEKRFMYNSMTRALIKYKSLKEGIDYLNSKAQDFVEQAFLENKTIEIALQSIKTLPIDQKKEGLMLCIKFLQDFESCLSYSNSELLSSIGKNWWSAEKTDFGNSEVCTSCSANLSSVSVDEETVNQLKNAFEISALKSSDIFLNTTPKEWEKFLEFLKKSGPFNLVVDGLNIFSKQSLKFFDPMEIIRALKNHSPNGKILIIFRKHVKANMLKLLNMEKKMFSNIDLFFLDNLTKDDVYIVYAALYSGVGCHIVSGDYLRNYKYIMDTQADMNKQFVYWQKSHQYRMGFRERPLKIKNSSQLHRVPQYNSEKCSWHLPIDDDREVAKLSWLEDQNEWLCLRAKKSLEEEHFVNRQTEKEGKMSERKSKKMNKKYESEYKEKENMNKKIGYAKIKEGNLKELHIRTIHSSHSPNTPFGKGGSLDALSKKKKNFYCS